MLLIDHLSSDRVAASIAIQLQTVIKNKKIKVMSSGLPASFLQKIGFEYCSDIQSAINDNLKVSDSNVRISVVTHGGLSCPIVLSEDTSYYDEKNID